MLQGELRKEILYRRFVFNESLLVGVRNERFERLAVRIQSVRPEILSHILDAASSERTFPLQAFKKIKIDPFGLHGTVNERTHPIVIPTADA